ncbi:MAG: SDR family oxidoreductase [Planctomycetota bacterium]|nr:SDR family oxidoreductase [Planctomycetota bacterium]
MTPRTVLVTGASRGIGEAIAKRFAADGCRVGLLARTEEALGRVADEIAAEDGIAEILVADLLEVEDTRAVVDAWIDAHGGVDVLVNNAGGNVRREAGDYTVDEWGRLIGLALTAPFFLSCQCADGMRERGFGRIVNVGSVAGMTALPTGAPYAAAKAGLAQLTRNLAREWGADGVTVNLVAPWYVKTPLTEGVLGDPGFFDAVLTATPTGRIGTPEEVAHAVRFLAGEDAGWINGVVLPLDGGFTAASFYPPA